MASSVRIFCGGGGGSACSVCRDRRTVTALSPLVISLRNWPPKIGKVSMTTTANLASSQAVKLDRTRNGERKRSGSVVSREKLDEWLRDSVVDIVKNLRESSLLVQLYVEANGGLTTTAAKTEAEEDWSVMEGRWERGEERKPEGVIFVEKLADDDVAERDQDSNGEGDDYNGGACGEGTSAWGIVAQGRGIDSGPVCYLLKTTRVRSGLGTVCTYFCLVKVKSFRETAMSQLNNFWLVQNCQ
ncbi:unnamed protein product [Cochlearia groenlandica]